jgi:hypothetical protein
MKARELFLKTHKYFVSTIAESKKIAGIVDIKGKVSASTGKREVSIQYESLDEPDIIVVLIDMIGCLKNDHIKSVKVEFTLHLINKSKVSMSDYIKSEDIKVEFGIDWEALEEAEAYNKTLFGKLHDERKLVNLIRGIV